MPQASRLTVAFVAAASSAILLVAASAAFRPAQRVILRDRTGATVGAVELTESALDLTARITAHGLAPGWHGMHLYETPSCKAANFADAAGHMGCAQAAHGYGSDAGSHSGDLPNIFANATGTATTELFSERLRLDPARAPPTRALVRKDAFVIQEHADDGSDRPSGNACTRIVCGIIET